MPSFVIAAQNTWSVWPFSFAFSANGLNSRTRLPLVASQSFIDLSKLVVSSCLPSAVQVTE